MSVIRYAGVYSGPSYGNPYEPSYEGFTSIAQAACRFRERQETSGTWGLDLDVTNLFVKDGVIDKVSEDSYYWPATTPQDTLELYAVHYEPECPPRISAEPFARLKAGPRGGVVRENY